MNVDRLRTLNYEPSYIDQRLYKSLLT
jgi:hypothetical protein